MCTDTPTSSAGRYTQDSRGTQLFLALQIQAVTYGLWLAFQAQTIERSKMPSPCSPVVQRTAKTVPALSRLLRKLPTRSPDQACSPHQGMLSSQAQRQRPLPALGLVFKTQWLLYLMNLVQTRWQNYRMWDWKKSNSSQSGPLLEMRRRTIH